jgi:hypothetical protein
VPVIGDIGQVAESIDRLPFISVKRIVAQDY